MKLRRLQRLLAAVIAYAMIFTLTTTAFAGTANVEDFTDLPARSNYTYDGLVAAINNGIMIGDGTGRIMPSHIITRVEAATYLVRVMGATVKADVSHIRDYQRGTWYDNEGSLAIALQMGLLDVENGMIYPEREITREEAFEMMARAFKASGGVAADLEEFPDANDIDKKYFDSIASLVKGGYVRGAVRGNTVIIDPKAKVSRGDFATLFGRVFDTYISAAGLYTDVFAGNTVIRAGDVTLRNLVVRGDLIIGEGAANGDGVTLDNVTVEGNLIARGGNISVNGDVNHIVIANNTVKLNLNSGSNVGALTVVGDNITVNTSRGSDIGTLTINGRNATVKGFVSIDDAFVNATGTVIESSPANTVIADNLTANIAGAQVSGTVTSTANRPTITLTLGSGIRSFSSLESLYAETAKLAATNHLIIEINSVPNAQIVIDRVNFPGNNNVTLKADTGFVAALDRGVSIRRNNVTLDGLSFSITDPRNIPRVGNTLCVIAVDGSGIGVNSANVTISNTTIRNCSIVFENYGAGANVAAVYFDGATTSKNSVVGSTINVTGQSLPYDTLGVHASTVTIHNTVIKSNDLALMITQGDALAATDVVISGTTKLYGMADAAVQLNLNKSVVASAENAFGTPFGGYSNLSAGAHRTLIGSIISSYIKTDVDYTAHGLKLRDYRTVLSELYYMDENGYVWSMFEDSRVFSYCNMPVSGTFSANRMYMFVDSNVSVLTTGDARYLRANGTLSNTFTDMKPLTSTRTMVANMPALNDNVTYKVIAMSPYVGDVRGLVADVDDSPYDVLTYFAANGTETTSSDSATAGNLNAARTGNISLAASSGSDINIFLYLSLTRATLGDDMLAWNYANGTGSVTVIDVDTNIAANPLAANRQRYTLDVVSADNILIIKGHDGNYLYLVVTVVAT
jgi:hypothetical protein